MSVVDAGVIDELHIPHRVLPDEKVVVVELVVHLVDDPVVAAVRKKLIATRWIREETIVVPLQVPRVLVVQVQAEACAIMVHVSADHAEWRVRRANPADRGAVPVPTGGTRRPDAIFVACNMIVQDVVGHPDQENARRHSPPAADPVDGTLLPPRADHSVRRNCVVHLVAVLRVDAYATSIPYDVLVYECLVGAMDGDANML
mmetsp:Transcript_68964/g.192036  ORF Transcript_68964/g.192036 Transcript_68964/m.192036 type:complete len:202 (+) Transcript_68964:163-768(+)